MVSPFWADIMTTNDDPNTASIYYRQTTDSQVLNQFQQQLYKVFPYLNGTSPVTWAFIATWYNVTYYPDANDQTKRNTFQCALGTNGVQSFAIFYYNQIQWTTGHASGGIDGLGGTPAQVGFDSGDGTNRYMLDVSCTDDVIDVADMSNVGPAGVFIFRIDSANIQTGSTITALPTTRRRSTTTSTTTALPTTQYQTTTTKYKTTTTQLKTTTMPPNPLSNAIGSQCSTNTSNAWLDVVLLIDISNSLTKADLNAHISQLQGLFYYFTIGQNSNHSTRVSIILFASDVQVLYNFNDTTNYNSLRNVLKSVVNYNRQNDTGGNVLAALQKAQNIFSTQSSYRARAIILSAAAYDFDSYGNANEAAQDLKDDGIQIITISLDSRSGIPPQISNLSSPGFNYNSSETDFYSVIPLALTQINCFCPENTIQFKLYDDPTKRFTYYADCLTFYNIPTLPFLTDCSPGVITSVTSGKKLEFIIDRTLQSGTYRNFTVGAFKNNGWLWQNYNDTSYPLGNFPPIPANAQGSYAIRRKSKRTYAVRLPISCM
uniref:VWFA domain-containing protein n=1 Tax=Panagrolaimus sp. JU765 TaxID=591449 RepID=A0AC34RFH1_9BILA